MNEIFTKKTCGDDSQNLYTSFEEVISKNVIDKKTTIKSKAEAILKFLNITSSSKEIVQLENAMKIHKYLSQNSSYVPDIMNDKKDYKVNEAYLNEVYNALVNKKGVCTTDSIAFKYLLSEIGMHGDVVILKSMEGGIHAATLVQLLNNFYYFDTTLERAIFEQHSNNSDRFVFCCAGLGQEEYGKFYTPVGILPENLNTPLLPIPGNISQKSMPKLIIQSIGSQIQNLKFHENTPDTELERF